MHIAIVRTEFVASRGGAERYAVSLARNWLEQGHRISVVCAKYDPQDARGMEVVEVSRPKWFGPFKHAWFASRAGKAALSSKPDAVLCLARAWPGDVLRLGDGLHKPWMAMRYPDLASRKRALLNPKHSQLLKLERELFLPGRFARYVCNSAMVQRQVVHMYGVDPARIVVIPNGVDEKRFNLSARLFRAAVRAEYGISREAKLVLFSGMDFRRKGLLEAVRGFIEFSRRDANARFACVGKGDASEARGELARAGLESRAVFVEATPKIEQWYGAADVFVLPTMYDPSANAVTEALACGTPVLTSQENGARQHVLDGKNGFVLHDRASAPELAGRIEELLKNPLDPAAVANAAPLISVRENSERMLKVLTEAVQARKTAAHGFSFSADQQKLWHETKGRAARLKLLRGWLWESGADVTLHELAKRLNA